MARRQATVSHFLLLFSIQSGFRTTNAWPSLRTQPGPVVHVRACSSSEGLLRVLPSFYIDSPSVWSDLKEQWQALSRPRGCSGKEGGTELGRACFMYFNCPNDRNLREPQDCIIRGHHGKAEPESWLGTIPAVWPYSSVSRFIISKPKEPFGCPWSCHFLLAWIMVFKEFLFPSVKWGEWFLLLCLPRLLERCGGFLGWNMLGLEAAS